jgi:hypothetical protein
MFSHLATMLVRASGGVIVPVLARGNAHQTARDLAPVRDHPTAAVVARVVPIPAHAVPVPAVYEENLLFVFRHNLHARADFDQDRWVFKPDGRDANLHLQVHLGCTGLGEGN